MKADRARRLALVTGLSAAVVLIGGPVATAAAVTVPTGQAATMSHPAFAQPTDLKCWEQPIGDTDHECWVI